MKKILIALGFTVAAVSAQAATITVNKLQLQDAQVVNLTHTDGNLAWGGTDGNVGDVATDAASGMYNAGYSGSLYATEDISFTATYLGKVASFTNFYLGDGVMADTVPGATNTIFVAAGGLVNFGFSTDNDPASTIFNGDANSYAVSQPGTSVSTLGILYFDATAWNALYGTSFDFLIGYNDIATNDEDYDDYVVGVTSVPVPAALPLMASALGAFGIARRRNKAKTA